jgi:hypothetical protein
MAILLPASVGIAVLLACVVALLAALAVAPAASAASPGDDVWFLVRCDFSHRASVDPIVFPYPPGNPVGEDPNYDHDSHSHDFLGNKTTDYNSTYDGSEAGSVKMINQPTTCSRTKDTAGYWFPTVSWNGKELTPNRVNFYYRAGGKDHTTVKPFPANLKVITGRVGWYCGTDDANVGSQDPPKNCKSGVLGVRIVFPDCSNGQIDDPNDHRSHMARSELQPDGTRKCPEETHPIPVPTLTVNANFPIPETSGTVTLSSGAASTMHSDFWNTWDQTELERLVVECINNVSPSDPRPKQCRAPIATAYSVLH